MVRNNYLKKTYLSNGNVLLQTCYKVTSLPHFSLLGEQVSDAILQIKNTFNTIIAEFYRHSYDKCSCMEIVWKNEKLVNQSHSSNIDFYIIIRMYGQNEFDVENKINNFSESLLSNLTNQKIFIAEDGFDLSDYLNSNPQISESRLVRKTESIENLGNFYVPQYYNVDFITPYTDELDEIVNYMISITDSVISIPIIPTALFDEEVNAINYMVNNMSLLVNGVQMPQPGAGYLRDSLAEKPLKNYSSMKENLKFGCYMACTLVFSSAPFIDILSNKVVVAYSGINLSEKNNFSTASSNEILNIYKNNQLSYPWIAIDSLMNINRLPVFSYQNFRQFYRLPYIYTPAELQEIFRVPIASKKITAGFNIMDIEKRNKTYTDGIINSADIILGSLMNITKNEKVDIGFNLKDLTRHMLVVGTPGQGKSTFLVGLMDRLWKMHNIPFLVIEPAKNEYRSLIDSIPDLQVFSPGKSKVAPYIINPFIPPKGVSLEVYKSIVKAAFSTAFDMWTPLDQLFDETLNICYNNKGWIDDTVVEDGKECFSLPDFINTYKQVVNSKGYTGEYKKQVEAAGVMRLNGLLEQNANIFDTKYTVQIEDIITKPTVIELSSIRDIKQKSFIIALLLNNIYAYTEVNLANDGKLKNVILLEEAHVLLGGENQISNTEGESANAQAVKLLTNMLAEIRSRGVGIVIADQSPKKVSSDVIANTNFKIAFRLVEEIDRQIIRKSSLMTDSQFERLAKLKVGQALIYFDKLDEVEEIVLDDYRLKNSISMDLSDESLRSRLTYWDDKQHYLVPYNECQCLNLCKHNCDFDIRQKARMIANNVFNATYGKYYKNEQELLAFFPKFSVLINKEIDKLIPQMNGNQRCVNCAKIYLNRKINYSTNINLSESTRINFAKKLNDLEKGDLNE